MVTESNVYGSYIQCLRSHRGELLMAEPLLNVHSCHHNGLSLPCFPGSGMLCAVLQAGPSLALRRGWG